MREGETVDKKGPKGREPESSGQGLPQGWREELVSKVDLELSFSRLKGYDHYYAQGLRGWIRSVQLRTREASKLLQRAVELGEKAAETVPDLVRLFMLHIVQFENVLLERPVKVEGELKAAWTPDLPEEVLEEYPEVQKVIAVRKRVEGMLRLHLGEYERAAGYFKELLREQKDQLSISSGFSYLGLAAAQYGLSLTEAFAKSLENAGWIVQSSGTTFDRAQAAAILCAFYRYLGEESRAEDWLTFIERLECPGATKELFARRAERILERCRLQETLLVL